MLIQFKKFHHIENNAIFHQELNIKKKMGPILANIVKDKLKEFDLNKNNINMLSIFNNFIENIEKLRKKFLYCIIKEIFGIINNDIKQLSINDIDRIYVYERDYKQLRWSNINNLNYYIQRAKFNYNKYDNNLQSLINSLMILILDCRYTSYTDLFYNIESMTIIIIYKINNIKYCYMRADLEYNNNIHTDINDLKKLNEYIIENNYYNSRSQIVSI